MQMKHKKCLEMIFCLNVQIEPTLLPIRPVTGLVCVSVGSLVCSSRVKSCRNAHLDVCYVEVVLRGSVGEAGGWMPLSTHS